MQICRLNESSKKAPDGRDIIILIYGSYNTESGAGHVSFAIGSNDNNLKYYSHYRQKDGGGITVAGVKLKDILGNYEKNNLNPDRSDMH